jgi:hypothetical protein
MTVLIGLCLAIALLYFWLGGRSFARVLVTLALWPVLGFVISAELSGPTQGIPDVSQDPVGVTLGVWLAGALSWAIASIPEYWHRSQRRYWRWQPISDRTPQWRLAERNRELLSTPEALEQLRRQQR